MMVSDFSINQNSGSANDRRPRIVTQIVNQLYRRFFIGWALEGS
jgi:hypothetical protein